MIKKLLVLLLVVNLVAIPCYGYEVIENGITYEITGDYPTGKYVKQIKNKGAHPKHWTKSEFFEAIPKAKRKLIWAAAASNEDIADWVEMIRTCNRLNSNMQWFTDGLDLMVPAIFTQEQVDTFLGR